MGKKLSWLILFFKFLYGWGGPGERRNTQVSESETLRHYICISLPQIKESQLLLVLCSMYQKIESVSRCIITYESSMTPSSFGESLSQLTQEQFQIVATHVLHGETTNNEVLKKPFSSVKCHCTSIGHSNEASTVPRQKYVSLWYFFDAPAIFVTFTSCDEYSFHVRRYTTTEEHKVHGVNEIHDESKALLYFKLRKKLRTRYDGAVAPLHDVIMTS